MLDKIFGKKKTPQGECGPWLAFWALDGAPASARGSCGQLAGSAASSSQPGAAPAAHAATAVQPAHEPEPRGNPVLRQHAGEQAVPWAVRAAGQLRPVCSPCPAPPWSAPARYPAPALPKGVCMCTLCVCSWVSVSVSMPACTPRAAELLRENKRMLDKAIRELDRERMQLQSQVQQRAERG